jgi:hypothetical protein
MPLTRDILLLRGKTEASPYSFDFANGATADRLAAGRFVFARAGTAYDLALGSYATGVPRIINSGLMLEGARSNYSLHSQDLEHTYWLLTAITVTANGGVTAPDGTSTADRLTETAGVAAPVIRKNSYPSGPTGKFATSAYVAYNSRRWVHMKMIDVATTEASAWFDMSSKTVGTLALATAGIINVDSTWYRLWMGWSPGTDFSSFRILHRPADNSEGNVTSAGTEFNDYFQLQVEEGSFPSAPIPTVATIQTRATESCVRAVSPFMRGTMLIKAKSPLGIGSGEEQILYQSDDGTASNRVRLVRQDDLSTKLIVTTGGTSFTALSLGTWANDTSKLVGFSISNGLVHGYMSGGALQTTMDATSPSCSRERLGHGGDDVTPASHWFGVIASVQRRALMGSAQLTAAVDAL